MASGAGGGVGDVAGQAFQAVEKALHTPMPFTTGGQTISDRLTAAKHSLAGSQLGKSICKATTEECIGPKKKHLDYLIHCTHEPNVSIPQMANLLIERTQNGNWCVVFKSLVTMHNLMCYGNERFTQYLASCNCDLNLHNFLDKTSINGYEMSAHVRHYGKYISEKIYTYRLCAFDFCKVKRGREDGLMRTMAPDKLLKTLPILQGQVDSLLEFSAAASELTNGIINSAFILLFRDLIRLFACYNDGIINLLEKYFDMNKKNCRDALDMYKKFLARMDNVAEFLKVAEAVGIDKGEIPDLAKAPHSLLEALEAHLAGLEGRVYSPSAPERPPAPSYQTSKYLREEEERMSRYKAAATERQVSNPPPAQAPTNPFAQPDLLSLSAPPTQPVQTRSTPIDDILALNAQQHSNPPANAAFNPFATAAPTNPFPTQPQPFNPFPQATNPYATQPIRMEAFPRMAAPPPMLFNAAPAPVTAPVHFAASTAPANTGLPRASGGGDLDGTLANLTANLNLQESREPRPVQWQSSASSNSSQPLKAQSPNQGWAPNFANSTPATNPPPNDPFGAL